jgi:hypothetical protein
MANVLTIVGTLGAVAFLGAALLHIAGRCRLAFAVIALTVVIGFQAVWYAAGPDLDNVDKVAALDRALDEAGVPDDARIVWADQRPDARLSFYFGRRSEYLVRPAEIVNRMVDRTGQDATLEQIAADKASELLAGEEPVYLILDRHNLDRFSHVVADAGHELAAVDTGAGSPAEDWVVITNLQ